MSLLELLLLIAATWQVYREQPAEWAAWRASFIRFAYRNSSCLWKTCGPLMPPFFSFCCLGSQGVFFFFSQCWFFTLWFRVRSPDRIRLCLAVAKKPLKKNQGISCALGECGKVHCCHLHQRSLIISSTISICLQYFKWVAQLKPLLKFKHMHKFSWAGSRKGPHRNRLQQVYSTISVELLEGGTVLTWFLWLLMIYLGFYVNKVSLLAYYNHHNESSKLSWP